MTSQNTIAVQFAPTFEWSGNACDVPTRVDFDGNQDVSDNPDHFLSINNNYKELAKNPGAHRFLGVSKVYFSAVSSETHYFLTYYTYYPIDKGWLGTGGPIEGHSNDASSLMLIVRKENNGDNSLEWAISSNHSQVDFFKPSDLLFCGGQLLVSIARNTHGLNPVLRDEGESEQCPKSTDRFLSAQPTNPDHQYDLIDIKTSLWRERYNPKIFCDALPTKAGTQYCASEGEFIEGIFQNPAYAPWARSFDQHNNAFIDPIHAFDKYYSEPNGHYSQHYITNPYSY